MSETIFNVLKIVGLFLTLGFGTVGAFFVISYIRRQIEKVTGEKVSGRIFDAIEKLKMVCAVLSKNLMLTLSKDAMNALADGVVTNEEVAMAITNVTKEVMDTLKDEIPALTKYFLSGATIECFIKKLIQTYIFDFIKGKLGIDKFKRTN